jgi:hypothetical protein
MIVTANSLTAKLQAKLLCTAAAIAICLACPFGLRAQNVAGQTTIISTGVPFLQITPDSRSGALGDAGVAIANNANALYWNPSALAFTSNRMGISLNYTPWLRNIIPDINHFFIPAYYNLGERSGVIGASLTYFTLGNIDFRDAQGNQIGNYNANEFAVTGAYSRKITKNLSGGVQLRYIRSDLAGAQNLGASITVNPAQSFSGDISLYYQKQLKKGIFDPNLPTQISWGVNISNLGAKISYTGLNSRQDFLPTNLRFGAAIKSKVDEYNSLTLTADVNKLMVPTNSASNAPLLSGIFGSFSDTTFSTQIRLYTIGGGVEYWYQEYVALRAGYFREDAIRGGRNFLTLGIGFNYKGVEIDFAYLQPFNQNNPLQNTLRFSVNYNLNQNGTKSAGIENE